MSLLGLDYGSGSSSDEDDDSNNAKISNRTNNNTNNKQPVTSLTSLLPPAAKRQKTSSPTSTNQPTPTMTTTTNTTTATAATTKPTRLLNKKNKGPSLAEKRAAMMARPEIIPDSDSEDEAPAQQEPAPDLRETGFVALLPQPKKSMQRRGGSALDGMNNNAKPSSEDSSTSSGTKSGGNAFVPYAIAKKQKEKRDQEAAKAEKAENGGGFFGTVFEPRSNDIEEAEEQEQEQEHIQYQITAQPQKVNAAPSSLEVKENVSAVKKTFGYGKAPVVQEQVVGYDDGAQGGAGSSRFEEVDVHGDEFQQLLGAKERNLAKWGRRQKEEIKFVDVDQANKVGSFDSWRDKYGPMQGSIQGSGPQTHTKKSADKGKHQLAWLATMAKERAQELEVKWASGDAKRKAAKQRYGF